MSRVKSKCVGSLGVLGLTLAALGSLGWTQDTECPFSTGDVYTSSTFTFNISTNDFSGTGTAYSTINQAGNYWDGFGSPIPGTDLEVAKVGDCNVENGAWGDGYESVTAEDLSGIGIALTQYWCTGAVITECDIAFHNGGTWHPDLPEYGESGWSRRPVMAHEVGHCLGFDHDNGSEDLLNSLYPSWEPIGDRVSISEGSRTGARSAYSDSSTGTDVAVAAMRFGDTPGKTEFIPFWNTGGGPQEAFAAWAGANIVRAYCLHNLGTTTQSNVTFKVYLSVDDSHIETSDVVLGTFTPSITPNSDPYCPERTLTIPSGTVPGAYWIGAIIDPADAISETIEANNLVRDAQQFTVY